MTVESALKWAVHTMLVVYPQWAKDDPSFRPIALERLRALRMWGRMCERIEETIKEIETNDPHGI